MNALGSGTLPIADHVKGPALESGTLPIADHVKGRGGPADEKDFRWAAL